MVLSSGVHASAYRTAYERADTPCHRREIVTLLGHDPHDPSIGPHARAHLYLRLGILDLKSQRYADAIDDFDQVLRLTQSAPALVDRAIAYTALGQPEVAIANYSAAILLDPKSVVPFINRAVLYAQRKQRELAVQDYSSALALQPDSAKAYFERASVLFDLKRYSLAATDYEKASRLRPADIELYRLAGVSHDRAGEFAEAIASYTIAIRLVPNHAYTYTERGKAYLHSGDIGNALADFSTAIRLDHSEVDALWMRAKQFEEINQLELAIDDYTAMLPLTAHPAQIYTYRADDLTDLGEDLAARQDYDRASQIDPDDLHLRFGRMRFRFYQGDYSGAIQDADRWLELVHRDDSDHSEQEPYVLAWRHMSSQRLGLNDKVSLAASADRLNKRVWPYPLIALYLGEVDGTQLLADTDAGDQAGLPGRQCEAYAYLGESYMGVRQDTAARNAFEAAIAVCPQKFVERVLAKRELRHLKDSNASQPLAGE